MTYWKWIKWSLVSKRLRTTDLHILFCQRQRKRKPKYWRIQIGFLLSLSSMMYTRICLPTMIQISILTLHQNYRHLHKKCEWFIIFISNLMSIFNSKYFVCKSTVYTLISYCSHALSRALQFTLGSSNEDWR